MQDNKIIRWMRSYHKASESQFMNAFLQKTPNNKLSASMLSGRNPQTNEMYKTQNLKLPSLLSMGSTGLVMRRSASTASQRNTKFKLVSMEDKLEELRVHVHNTRLDTQQAMKEVKMMGQLFVESELPKHREDLKKQIKGLERFVRASVAGDEERTGVLKRDCEGLWQQTEDMRQAVFQLRIKIQDVDCILGFKS